MLALRKSYPDGCLPMIKSTGLHAFNNIMIFKVPEELRKPGETKYQLATLDPAKDDTTWPADEYVKKLYPDYPMKEKHEEKHIEEKESVVLKKSTARTESKTKHNIRHDFRYNQDKKHYQKHTKQTSVRRSYPQRPYYKHQKNSSRDNRRYRAPKPSNAADNIDPWLRPAIPERIIAPSLIMNQPSAEALYLRPEPSVIHPPAVPFYNQPFNNNNARSLPFNGNNNRSPSFNGNNALPAPSYAKPKKCVGLLGDCPAENTSFDNGYAEYSPADNSFDDDNNYADGSFDDYPSYQSYEHDGTGWKEKRPGGWNDGYQDFNQKRYRGNPARGRNPGREENINFSESRGWKGNRGTMNRRTMSRGAMNRGTMNRAMDRGRGNRGAFRGNRRGRW